MSDKILPSNSSKKSSADNKHHEAYPLYGICEMVAKDPELRDSPFAILAVLDKLREYGN